MPPLPAGVQPPAFKTPFFNPKTRQIDEEWKRCFLSWQSAINGLLEFTQHAGGNQGLLALDDPEAGEPVLTLTPIPQAPPSPPSLSQAFSVLLDSPDAEFDPWLIPSSTIVPVVPSLPGATLAFPETEGSETEPWFSPGSTAVQRSFITNTATGTQNNWAPGLSGDTTVEWSGASTLTVTGIAGGFLGQFFTLKNTGSSNAFFQNANAGSTAANQLTNVVTSGDTPVAPGGSIQYVYDGTNWKLIRHEQGAGITRAFAAGNYTANGAMTWTVVAGNVSDEKYWVRGKILHLEINIVSTTVGGTPNTQLIISTPGGYSAPVQIRSTYAAVDLGGSPVSQNSVVDATGTQLNCFWDVNADNWPATADARIQITKDFEIT